MKHTLSHYPHKSTAALRSSVVLFSLISNPTIVRLALLSWKFLRFFRIPITPLVRFTGYYQFCAGKDVAASGTITTKMAQFGVQSVLDYANEHATNEHDFEDNLAAILETIREAKNNTAYPFAVLKPTAIGSFLLFEKMSTTNTLKHDELRAWNAIAKRLELCATEAKQSGIVLMIDAEESWIQAGVDKLILPLVKKYNKNRVVVAITLQLYLKERFSMYQKMIDEATKKDYFLGVKLVRGAYMEKERNRALKLGITSPVCDTKEHTDNQYHEALGLGVHHLNKHLCIVATHNEQDIAWVLGLCAEKNILLNTPNLWFSQLYGMRDYISFDLAAQGANVFKYVPFGPLEQSIPYLIRRALENSSMKNQTKREQFMLKQELKRRKAIA